MRDVIDIVLRKNGSSTVVTLPPSVLRDLSWSAGHTVTLNTTNEGTLVLTRKYEHVLSDLLAQCDPEAAPPADLEMCDAAKSMGQEVW